MEGANFLIRVRLFIKPKKCQNKIVKLEKSEYKNNSKNQTTEMRAQHKTHKQHIKRFK